MKRIILLFLVLGCSSRPDVAPGTLSITPNPATFRPIEKGEEEVSQNLFIRNRGREPITILRVGLTELDETQELSIPEMDTWTNVSLAPNEERRLQVNWRPVDTELDIGRVEISIQDQLPVAVPIRSPEMPAFVDVDTNPEGTAIEGAYSLVLNGAPLGGRQAAWINVRAASLAGLTVSQFCLASDNGDCLAETNDGFALCAGRVTRPDECASPEAPTQLAQGDTLQATVFFTPQVDSDDLFQRRVLIESNDRDFPQYFVELSATVCRGDGSGSGCGPCGNRQIDPGEECDDGNRNDEDDCRNDCVLPTCFDPPDSDGDGLSDRCDDRPNIADFSVGGRVHFVGGRNVNDQHTQMGGASTGRIKSNNEQFKHRARVFQ